MHQARTILLVSDRVILDSQLAAVLGQAPSSGWRLERCAPDAALLPCVPDVVLLEIPEPSAGPALVARVRARCGPAPVVALLPRPDGAAEAALLDQGALDVLALDGLDAARLGHVLRLVLRLAERATADRRRLDEALALSAESHWRLVLDPPLPVELPEDEQIARIVADARLADANAVAARLYGFAQPGDAVGLPLHQLTVNVGGPPEAALRRFVRSGYRLSLLRDLRDGDGGLRYMQVSWQGWVVDGCLRHIAGAQSDVTAVQNSRGVEAQLSAIVTASDDAIVSMALDGTIRTWNPGAERLYGYSAATAIGRSFLMLLPPAAREPARTRFDAFLASGTSTRIEEPVVRGDGTLQDAVITVSPMCAPDGQIVGVATIGHDVTALKQAGARIADSERRFRTVLDNSRDAIFELNLATRMYDYASPSVQDILGFDIETFGMGGAELFRAHIHADDLAMVDRSFEQLLGDPEAATRPFEIEYRFQTPDHGMRWLHSARQVVRAADGRPLSVVGSIRDVTESKRLLDTLRESEQRFRNVVEATQEGVFMVDLDGAITFVNERLAHMLGYESEALVGKPLIGLSAITDTAELEAHLARWSRMHNDKYEILLRHHSGSVLSCYASSASIFNERRDVVGAFGMVLDITDQKRAEAQLRDTQLRFGNAIANSRDVIYQYNLVTAAFEYGSPSVEELLGFSLEEFEAGGLRLLYANVHPDDVAWFKAFNAQLTQEAPAERMLPLIEYRFRTKHRGWRWISDSRRFIHDANGRARLIIGNIRDVTEARETEAALRQSEERLAQAQRLAHLGYWEIDLVSGSVYWSEELCRIYGIDAQTEPINEATADRYIHPDDAAMLRETTSAVLTEQRMSNVDHRIIRKGGEIRYLNSQTRCILDENQQPVRLAGIVLDVTERKLVEQALRQSEERLVAAQRIAHLGSWTFTFATQQYEWSVEMTQILGLPEGERSRSRALLDDLVYPDDLPLLHRTIATMYQNGQPWDIDVRVVRPSGEVRVVNIQGELSCDAEGRPISAVGTALDITERQQAEAELRSSQRALQQAHDELERRVEERTRQLEQAKDEAVRANAAKSEFLSRMSHELRTPMNSILGFAQIMEMDALPGRQADRVGFIMKAGQHLLRLINEVLDLARVESGRLDIAPEPVAVRRSIEAAASLIRPLAEQRNQLIILSGPTGADVYVEADQQRLSQVLINLLSNASKYNRDGGTIRIGCSHPGAGRLRIAVTDTGHGIAPHQITRLFTPFERLDAASSEVEGTGLGLALSKRLVELMGGAIGVESRVGHGSTFWVELPLSAAAPVEAVAAPAMRPDLTYGDERRTLLYIEDNLANLEVVEHVLSTSPEITLLSAMQGQIGLELAREHQPDIILLDVQLPDISGEDVLRRLGESDLTREIPVVVVSADATSAQIRKMLAAGAREYLTKPLDIRRFLEVVGALLRRAPTPSER